MHRTEDEVVRPSAPQRAMVWLGGGQSADVALFGESGAYSIAGVIVTAIGALTAVFATLALLATNLPWPVAVLLGIGLGIVATLLARFIATAARNRGQTAGQVAVAVVLGVALAELVSMTLFNSSIDQQLRTQAAQTSNASVDTLTAERARLDTAVAAATAESDRTLQIAICEYRPGPQCPTDQVTGDPGRGRESQTATSAHEAAEAEKQRLLLQRGEIDRKITAASDHSATTLTSTDAPQAGLGSHWSALNSYSSDHLSAVLMRIGAVVLSVGLCLLPLLLRAWRGETSLDRRKAVREAEDQAERDADAEIARQRAAARVEQERIWREQQLESEAMAAQAKLDLERVEHEKELAAASFVDGLPELEPLPTVAELEAGVNQSPPMSGELVLPSKEVAPKSSLLGTAARFARPLVPGFVAKAIDVGTTPVRAVKQAFEETEEITFTLKRSRKVSVSGVAIGDFDQIDSDPPPLPRAKIIDAAPEGPLTYLEAGQYSEAVSLLPPEPDKALPPAEPSGGRHAKDPDLDDDN